MSWSLHLQSPSSTWHRSSTEQRRNRHAVHATPARFQAGAHTPCSTLADEQGSVSLQRRSILTGGALFGMLALPAQPALADGFFERGLSKYIKKKRLDPLDTYVPLVLEAREQLEEAGKVMIDQPSAARDFLRKGAFDGLRENIRVLGEYAVINKKEAQAGPLVNNFFRNLEDFDLVLALAVREEKTVDEAAAKSGFEKTTQAMDALLATVPEDVMYRSKRVLEVARAKERAAAAEEQASSSASASTTPDAGSSPAADAPASSSTGSEAPAGGAAGEARLAPQEPYEDDLPWPAPEMPGAPADAEPGVGVQPDGSLDEGVLAAPPTTETVTVVPPSVEEA